jgi:hypothetical protein
MSMVARAICTFALLALTTSCGASDENSTLRRALVTKEIIVESLPNACTLLDEALAEQILGSAVSAGVTTHANNAVSQCGWHPADKSSPTVALKLNAWTRSQLDPEKQRTDFGSTVAGYSNAEYVDPVQDLGRWAGLLKNNQGEFLLYVTTPYFLDPYSPGVATNGIHMTVSHDGLTEPEAALAVLRPIALELLERIASPPATGSSQ